MSNILSKSLSSILVGVALLTQCQHRSSSPEFFDPVWPDRVPSGQINFEQSVKPILESHCLECHNGSHAAEFAGLNLETRNLALTTGRSAPVIIPGRPESSPLIMVLELNPHHEASMPAAQEKVEGVRLKILKKWIKQGAEWPEHVRLQAS